MKTFGRVLTAMVTSFNNDGSVNIENSITIANHLLDNGSDGLVVCGTTGENPTMSKEDKLALFTAIAKECGHKAIILNTIVHEKRYECSLEDFLTIATEVPIEERINADSVEE